MPVKEGLTEEHEFNPYCFDDVKLQCEAGSRGLPLRMCTVRDASFKEHYQSPKGKDFTDHVKLQREAGSGGLPLRMCTGA